MEVKVKLLEKEELRIVRSFVAYSEKLDVSSKALWEVFVEFFKANKGQDKSILKASLFKQVQEVIGSKLNSNVKARIKKLIELSADADKHSISFKEEVYFYNLEQIMKLLIFVSENEKDMKLKYKNTKEKLQKAINASSEEGIVKYNDEVSKVIKSIKKINKIKGESDDFQLQFSKMSKEALLKLIQEAQEELAKREG